MYDKKIYNKLKFIVNGVCVKKKFDNIEIIWLKLFIYKWLCNVMKNIDICNNFL